MAPKTAAAAALSAVVVLLQQGKNEMSMGAAETKTQNHLDKAAMHYEAAVRLFRYLPNRKMLQCLQC